MAVSRQIRLSRQWPQHVKSGVLHAISLASVALSYSRGRATSRSRLRAKLEQATAEIALLREELNIDQGLCVPAPKPDEQTVRVFFGLRAGSRTPPGVPAAHSAVSLATS